MKKILICIISLFLITEITAQEITPQTTISVTLKVQKEQIIMGPYARYAKKYLGLNVPLNNKTIYTIVGTSIGTENFKNKTELSGRVELYNRENNEITNGSKIVGEAPMMDYTDISLSPIVTSTGIEMSDVELAKKAAETIFALRERRFDLITGEYGENVFGAGLGAAINEINRLEKEYIKLFVGKTNIYEESYIFHITPVKGEKRFIISRFSDTKGILSDTDVTGDPCFLSLKDLNLVKKPANDANEKKRSKDIEPLKFYPDLVECTVYVGNKMILSRDMEIYQFGERF